MGLEQKSLWCSSCITLKWNGGGRLVGEGLHHTPHATCRLKRHYGVFLFCFFPFLLLQYFEYGRFCRTFDDKLLAKTGSRDRNRLDRKDCRSFVLCVHWCPPCRQFPSQIGEWYKPICCRGIEVVFITDGKDQKTFLVYFGEMLWLALPFTEEAI